MGCATCGPCRVWIANPPRDEKRAAVAPIGGGDFDLSRHTIDDGGGGLSTGGGFELAGTIGEPDAGPVMTGGNFALLGGFWPGVGTQSAPPCPWDLNDDGNVNSADLNILALNWQTITTPNVPGDATGDGSRQYSRIVDLSPSGRDRNVTKSD